MAERLKIEMIRLDDRVPTPSRAMEDDAGLDLYAAHDAELEPGGGRALVGTGVAVAIPRGYAGFVQPRSGLALRHGVTCLNTPGLIDPGYRGEVKVLLVNTDPSEKHFVRRGDRIAQLVVIPIPHVELVEVSMLPPTQRGEGGFGHTGR